MWASAVHQVTWGRWLRLSEGHGYLLHEGHGIGEGWMDSWLSTLLPDPCFLLFLCGPSMSRCQYLVWQGSEQCWEWDVAGGETVSA